MNSRNISANNKERRTNNARNGFFGILLIAGILITVLFINSGVAGTGNSPAPSGNAVTTPDSQTLSANVAPAFNPQTKPRITSAERKTAAVRAALASRQVGAMVAAPTLVPGPNGVLVPDYFGTTPNFANSPLPKVNPATGAISGGMRKFVDSLPGLGVPNNLGQYIPIAVNDSTTYPGSDYYEIALVQYAEKMHSDLNITTLRGYVQLETPANAQASKHIPLKYPNGSNITSASGLQVYAVDIPHYLGPIIISQQNRPVRVRFINYLPAGAGGNLFIPVDTTIMGAGMGPLTASGTPCDPSLAGAMCESYTQNRATLHLHGGNTPWISDGTQHQWTTPAGEATVYPKGVSVAYVPDMWFNTTGAIVPAGTPASTNNPGNGSLTFYYTNQQSARLMFYHDHAYGITRLNVYAGEAAAYLVRDQAEQALVTSGVIPPDEIPLVIQDKTFLPGAAQLAAQDPTWNWGKNYTGDLWFPHVYMTNQNPYVLGGANAMGRWDYGPWFWPVFPVTNGMVPNPYYDPINAPWEPPMIPGTPNPSIVPEAFMDTPLVNGNAYPNLTVKPRAYRFRILNAGNDRMLNLQLYYAATAGPFVVINSTDGNGSGASATVRVIGGVITNITVTSGGTGYTAAPTVSVFNPPGISGPNLPASAVATIDPVAGMVTSISITNRGSGYSVPTICKGPGTASSLCTEVSMVPANPAVPGCSITSWPAGWPTPDGRVGGWPDPNTIGPSMIQIGTEGGFLPNWTEIPNRPIGYDYNRRSITVLNVLEKALFLGPAERADVIVDFSTVPAGSTLILYNDAPAPVPGFDPRFDYYTGDPDQTITGGAPSTIPGYGPNTRTIMQIKVTGVPALPFNLANLATALPAAYNQSQDKPIVPQDAYNAAFNTSYPANAFARIQDTSMTFRPADWPALLPVRSITVTNGGSGYTSAPIVTIDPPPGGQTRATATATLGFGIASIAVTNPGNNYISPPTVTITGGGGTGATARVTIANRKVAGITVTNPGSGYTSVPRVTLTGGGGTGATARAILATVGAVKVITLTNAGSNYTIAPNVTIAPPTTVGGITATAVASLDLTMVMKPKAIQELFDPDYGRMNAMLGVEVPFTNALIQTTIPYWDVDPPTEIFMNSNGSTLIGTLEDGTQIWKITHNGVDTHALHWHMFNVQVINRVGWDGAIKPPDPNEFGWKETVRMNPLEDIIIAMRPIIPDIPWDLPNSIRYLDPTMPPGTSVQFTGVDPTNQPAPVTNQMVNYGWEYLWHCHLLGHEENIMMRTVSVAVAPRAPANLSVSGGVLNWTDNSTNEISFTVQRATSVNGPWVDWKVVTSTTGPGIGKLYSVTGAGGTYFYRVIATNIVGYTQIYAPPAAGYPAMYAKSTPSNIV